MASAERRRSPAGGVGSQFDPGLSELLCVGSEEILGGLDSAHTWEAVIAAEPALGVRLSGTQFDAALLAVANFVDLKSPYTLGHARAVSDLAAAAGERLGLAPENVALLRRAALVHGFGRLGVSNAIWDKRGPLGAGEWERVRLQPYLTERMLHQSPSLAPSAPSRCRSGSDWTARAIRAAFPAGLSPPRRVCWVPPTPTSRCASRVLTGRRAPPKKLPPRLRAEVKATRLDRDSVEAVLEVAGHHVPGRREGPAGLTAREVDVLRLVARGLSSKEVASRLVISPKTARNHIEHIYVKIGSSSRVEASMFAMRHGLLPDGDGLNP